MVPKNKLGLSIEALIFILFQKQLLMIKHDVISNVIDQMQHWSFDIFQENLQIPLCWYFSQRPLLTKRIQTHSRFWIQGQELSYVWSTWCRRDIQKMQITKKNI
jgi:hypothetical protein